MSSKGFLVPYDNDGNMLEVDMYNTPHGLCNGKWLPNNEFKARMTYVRWARGRSAVTVYLTDDAGHEYPMIGRYFFDMIHLMNKGSIIGTWKAIKRGQTYSLCMSG